MPGWRVKPDIIRCCPWPSEFEHDDAERPNRVLRRMSGFVRLAFGNVVKVVFRGVCARLE
jgi:hypothetical protein